MDQNLLEFLKEELRAKQRTLWNDLGSAPVGELLHYTDPSAFRSILQNREFWCTDFAQVNDRNEFTYGMDIIRSVVLRKSVSPPFREHLMRTNLGVKDVWTTYIACFCSGAERDHMRSEYAAASAGGAIAFDYKQLFDAGQDGRKYAVFRILYDRSKQVEIVEQTVVHARWLARDNNLGNRDMAQYWFEVLFPLLGCASRFKHPRWSSEQEFRLGVTSGAEITPFQVLEKRRVSIPFEASAVTRVIRGKAAESLPIDSIRTLLDQAGYRSDLPIRRSTLLNVLGGCELAGHRL